jgi:hypothetical protein
MGQMGWYSASDLIGRQGYQKAYSSAIWDRQGREYSDLRVES